MRKIIVLLIVVLTLFLIIGGLTIVLKGNKSKANLSTQLDQTAEVDKSIFSAQMATIDGKIIKISGNNATITSKSGVTADFPLSSNLTINKLDSNQKMINSNKKEDIEVNKDVVVFLNSENGSYLINTITYTPPMAPQKIPVPPTTGTTSSASATKASPKPQNQ